MSKKSFSMSQLLDELKRMELHDASQRQVRYFIQKGWLPKPKGTRGGARYDEDHLYRIIAIHKLWRRLRLSEIQPELDRMTADKIRDLATQEEKETPPMSIEKAETEIRKGFFDALPPSLFHDEQAKIVNRRTESQLLIECRSPVFTSPILKENSWLRFDLLDGVELSVRSDILGRLEEHVPILAEEIQTILSGISQQGEAIIPLRKEYEISESISEQYECYRLNGHLFAEIGGHRALLDTGFPQSFGNCGTLSICGRDFQVPGELNFPTAIYSTEEFGKLIETTFDIFIGADILKEFDFLIDLIEGKITFTDHIEYSGNNLIGILLKDGLPIAQIQLEGKSYPFLIATGNKLSFLSSDLARNHPIVGKGTDYLPRIWDFEGGKFETDLRRVRFRLGNNNYMLPFGHSPRQLEEALWIGLGVMGILGGELLERRPLGFSLRRNMIF